MLYIHNTTEMVAILDGGNGEEENTEGGGWDVESIITQVPNGTWSCFRPSFKIKR